MKKALITGASEGMGRVFARELKKLGYQVTAVARNESRLKELGCNYFAADLASEDGLEKVCKILSSGEFDLLVNNAGFGAFGRFEEVPIATHLNMIRVNCEALTSLSHAFLKSARGGHTLLNVASTAAFNSIPYNGTYAATKAYVLSLTEALWFEQKARGVRVFALCPGYTLTEFTKRAGADDKAMFRKYAQTPDEVVAAAIRELRSNAPGPFVISGTQNRTLTSLQKLLPRSTVTRLAARMFAKLLSEA